MESLRFERRGEDNYYRVLLHVGSTYFPVSDEDVEELKKQSAMPGNKFLEFFLDRMGHSSYLKDQIKIELEKLGNPEKQISTLRQYIIEL